MDITWVFRVILKSSDVKPNKAGPTNSPKKPKVVRFAAAVLRLSVVFLRATLIAIGKKLADANPKRNKPNNIKYIFPFKIIPK